MQPLRLLCAEHHLCQVQCTTHKHPSIVDKEHKGMHKDGKACNDGNACDRSDVHNDSGMCNTSNACNSSASSSCHALIKCASEGKLCIQCSVHERQHVDVIMWAATGATRVWTPGQDRGTSHAH